MPTKSRLNVLTLKCPQGSSVVFRRNQSPPEKECSPRPKGCIRRNSKDENLADVGDEEAHLFSVIHSDEGSCAVRSHGNRRPSSLFIYDTTQYIAYPISMDCSRMSSSRLL